jgi:hypothetical protein
MRIKSVVGLAFLWGLAPAFFTAGCDNSGANPPMIKAPPAQGGTTTPLPPEKTKGGGAGSSGNMKGPPGGPY